MATAHVTALLNRDETPGSPAYACTARVLLPRVTPQRRGWGGTSLKIPITPLVLAFRWLLRAPCVVMTEAERVDYARDMRVPIEDVPEVDFLQSFEMLADVLRSRLLEGEGEPIVFADDLAHYPYGRHGCLQRDAVELRVKFVHPAKHGCYIEQAAYAEYDPVGRCLNVRLDPKAWEAPDDADNVALALLEFKFPARAPYSVERDSALGRFINDFKGCLSSFQQAIDILQATRPEM